MTSSKRFAMLALVMLASAATTASAQGRYRPSRPTFSPYLDYFRQDVGALDPYNTFLSPNRALQDRIGGLENQFGNFARATQSAAPASGRSHFSSYSHYYTIRRRR